MAMGIWEWQTVTRCRTATSRAHVGTFLWSDWREKGRVEGHGAFQRASVPTRRGRAGPMTFDALTFVAGMLPPLTPRMSTLARNRETDGFVYACNSLALG